MTKKTILIIISAAILCGTATARPARSGLIQLSQPDGSTFGAYIRGDEFMRIKTTVSGNAIVQDQDGWWCYARYGQEGRISSSGFRIGHKAPQEIISASLDIPYASLAANAASKRCTDDGTGTMPPIRKIIKHQGVEVKAGGKAASKHGLVILAEYQDIKFRYKKEDFVNMLTQEGYSLNGATGSAKEYFDAQFNGSIDFSFTVSEIVTLGKMRSYYGGNGQDGQDKNAAEMIREACVLADPEIDFSLFDDDGDGKVDNVFVFFAGEDEAEGAGEDCIWSHAWYIYSGAGIRLTLDGKRIDRYACTSELTKNGTKKILAGIGTFCHEYSHTLGLPDFYDTNYEKEGGWAAGLWGRTSLMDGGNDNNNGNTPPYLNAIEREILGIGSPVIIENDGAYTLEPVNLNGSYCRLDTDTPGEYYLFEYRSAKGWDKYCGGNGMLVYHVDRSSGYISRWNYENTVNAYSGHQCADLIEADGRTDSFPDSQTYFTQTRNISGIFFPYGNVTSLTSQSDPGLTFWNGKECPASVTGITRGEESVSFSVSGFGSMGTPPSPTEIQAEAYTDAAAITFASSRPWPSEATVTWGRNTQSMETVKVRPYTTGRYAVILEGLEPGNKTYTVSVHFESGDMKGESKSVSFMTTRQPPVKWPYLFTGRQAKVSGKYAKGERIPLRICNAPGAAEIKWTFDGKEIVPEPDGRFTVTGKGVLRAYIYNEDGSMDVIMKEINTEP